MQRKSPTKGNLLVAEKSLELAMVGYELMDKKRNILIREIMGLVDKAQALRSVIDSTYQEAYQALQNANISLGTCQEIVSTLPVEEGLALSFRSVMGAELAQLSLESPEGTEDMLSYPLSTTNPAFDDAYQKFQKVKLMLVELAELENNIYRLATAIKQTRSRANALENLIIPQHKETIRSITLALEESEREEFMRLKVIKQKKK